MVRISPDTFITGLQGKSIFEKLQFNTNHFDTKIKFQIFFNDRFWWILAFGLLLTFCGTTIQKMWKNWDKNPVSIEISNRVIPISAIPFPTVTVCTKTKTSKEKLDIHAIYEGIEAAQLNMDNLTSLE